MTASLEFGEASSRVAGRQGLNCRTVRAGPVYRLPVILDHPGGSVYQTNSVVVQGGLYEVFGNVLGILSDNNSDGTVDRDDILVSGDTGFVQFDVRIADPDFFSATVPLDFGVSVPGLGLEFSDGAGIELEVGYEFAFGFGRHKFKLERLAAQPQADRENR